VLAGHSFGGLYVRTFAARYPGEVAGMVLVDSTASKSAAKPGAASAGDPGSYDGIGRVSALVSTSARLGLARLYGRFDFGGLPPQSRDEARATGATASSLRSTIDEYVQANSSMEQAAAFTDFTNKPLVVLTAGSGNDAAWQAKQKDLTTLSTNSAQRVIKGAIHEALVADEEYAAATTQAIVDVVTSVRSAQPLAR
jgi:pimeloyl-ACP methyl ester carboxylesterase